MLNDKPAALTECSVETDDEAKPGVASAEKVQAADAVQVAPPEPNEAWLLRFRLATRSSLGFGRKLLNPPVGLALFNVAVVLICMGLFFTFLTTIIRDYLTALAQPPTVLGISVQNPVFPDVLICNTMSIWEVAAINSCTVDYSSGGFDKCCTTFKVLDPASGDENCEISYMTFNITSLRPGRTDSACIQFHTDSLRGFVETEGFAIPNSLEFDIDATMKEKVSRQTVKSLSLFTYDGQEELAIAAERGQLRYEELVELTTGAAFLEPFRYSQILLDLEINKLADQSVFHVYRLRQDNAEFADASPNHTEFQLNIRFASNRIRTLTETQPSFAAAFGSAAGWLGALSDGWGCISILFFVEKIILICKGRRRPWAD